MQPRLSTLALCVALLVPTGLLAWIGATTLADDVARGRERFERQAQALAESLRQGVRERIEGLARDGFDPDAWPVRFASDGAWLGERLERPAAAGSPSDALALLNLQAEVDRWQARGEIAAALERLASVTDRSEDPELAAWALGTIAALAERANDRDLARRARERLVAEHPTARDGTGVRRALTARREMARLADEPSAALLSLWGDALVDHVELGDLANAEFLRGLRQELELAPPRDLARLAEFDHLDAERERLRQWNASIGAGISDWIARGAPGSTQLFALARSPIPSSNPRIAARRGRPGEGHVLVAVGRAGEEWVGAALELDRLFEGELARLASEPTSSALGFEVSLRGPPPELDSGASATEPLVVAPLPPPFSAWTCSVHGGDLEGFLERERGRALVTAGLVGLALAAAAVGVWATLRGVRREVEAARGREAFVAAVTHELKAPLAAIRLFAEMFERGDVEPEKVREFGGRTVRESDRLSRLIDSVLDLARLEGERGGVARERVALDEIVAEARASVAPLAAERGVTIDVRGAGGLHVLGDRDALIGALVNLLDNALKYSEGAAPVEIELARGSAGRVELAVLDRGRGVPLEERERIFEAFRRIGDELTRDRPGVGLGLALVRKIAERHGGSARCEARDGGGSRFVIELPEAEGPST